MEEAPDPLFEWEGQEARVSLIEIHLGDQKAVFYADDRLIGWTRVATGVRRHPTPSGYYQVLEKVVNKRSNLYGKIYDRRGRVINSDAKQGRDRIPPGGRFVGAKMPYFLRLSNDGIGMHAGPIPRPGYPASHGCIRMPKDFAATLYRYVDIGTPVVVIDVLSNLSDQGTVRN